MGFRVEAARSQISILPPLVAVPNTVEFVGHHCTSFTSSFVDWNVRRACSCNSNSTKFRTLDCLNCNRHLLFWIMKMHGVVYGDARQLMH